MPSYEPRQAFRRRARTAMCVCGMGAVASLFASTPGPDQPAGDNVGIIEGADIAVTGPMSVEVVGGQVKTVLRSGSEVRVKSGQARISLAESGQISICGPAHFSVLKSGGALTLALDSGIVRMRLDRAPALTVYTAQIQAQPVAIGDEPRDFLFGFENTGAMCVRTYSGAMRLEQQLSGQNVMVPQGGDILLANGQLDSLRNGAGRCSCELEMAKLQPVAVAPVPAPTAAAPQPGSIAEGNTEASIVSSAPSRVEAAPAVAQPVEKPARKNDPVYQVSLPPLRYDATAKVQPEPDARLMLIVRRVRVRPTLIFQGRVEGEAAATAVSAPPPKMPASVAPVSSPPAQLSVVARVWSFFRSLWARGR